MFAGRRPHPVHSMPWKVQTFVCTRCSAITTRQPGDDAPARVSRASVRPSLGAETWTGEYGSYTALLDGRLHRIVAYPRGSPLAGKFGCYCEGRHTGLTADLAAAKAWCQTWAERTSSSLSANTAAPASAI
jgi:hypothetical protein